MKVRGSLAVVVVLACAVACAPAAARQSDAPPPGFQADLGEGGVHVECSVFRGTLDCLIYGRPPFRSGRSCDFGGTIATVRLRRSGRARLDNTCVDEGYHGWDVLAEGATFRSGRFTCRNRGRSLVCSRGSRRFTIGRRGTVRR